MSDTDSRKVRSFGVSDADAYWQEREKAGRTSEKRVHYFIRDLVLKNVTPPGTVLVCGVGDGHEYRLCSQHLETWGVEMSQHAIDQYEFDTSRIAKADLNGGIPDFPVHFNAITVSMVLHWLDDPEGFLREAKNSLVEGGCLVVIVPNITHYRYRLGFLRGRFPPISPSHKNFQTPAEVEAMFRRAGYRLIEKASSKNALKARLRPNLFATDIGYVLRPE